uniref:Uncharacterized protein n=1 Tax=Cacopsylla melanoneura TaxID=428564 RepID=A0A8D8VS02_9HEMI
MMDPVSQLVYRVLSWGWVQWLLTRQWLCTRSALRRDHRSVSRRETLSPSRKHRNSGGMVRLEEPKDGSLRPTLRYKWTFLVQLLYLRLLLVAQFLLLFLPLN